MKRLTFTCAISFAILGATAATAADTPDLKQFLVDIGPGAVGAHEILGLPASVVSNIQTPKDFTAAVSAANGDAGKSGFGIAFTPARSGFRQLAVSIGDYSTDGNVFTRLWGGTTFSYAQGGKTLAGVDYEQQAVALQVSYYLRKDDDPSIAARAAFVNCKARMVDEAAFTDKVLKLWEAKRKALGPNPTQEQEAAVKDELRAEVKADFAAAGVECVAKGFKDANAKWNKSQLGLTLGQGWIKGPAGGLGRTSLGQHAALTLAWAPQDMQNSLFNLTVRRVSREVDTGTLAGTPSFKSSSLAALRYTYGYGEGQDTYLLAEVSNVKASKLTESNAAFKSALGIDRRIGKGVWLELRAGRSRTEAAGKEETKVLFNLKLSPEATVPSLRGS
jgi:hypothetical protein